MERVGFRHATRMRQNRKSAGTKAHNYDLPAIAWRQILDQLYPQVFGERGGQRRGIPQSLFTAVKRIQAAVSTREHHPALLGMGVMGSQSEVLAVWWGDDKWSPYPVAGSEMQLLLPVHDEAKGHPVTTWYAKHPDDAHPSLRGRYSLIEANHLEFVAA